MRLEFYQSNSKMPKKLEKISEVLQKDMSFLEKVAKDFKTLPELRSTLKMLSAPTICSPRQRRPNRCSSTPAFAPPKAGRTKGSSAGAKGMTIEQVVRVAILKQLRQLGYEELYDELNDNISYRRFGKIHEGEVPKKITLNENIKRISPEGWEEIHKVIIKTAKELGVEKGKKVRMDSTGVESNIHYPTDGDWVSQSYKEGKEAQIQDSQYE